MNQSVRRNEADMDNILTSLLDVATNAAPHSPEIDRLAESIEYLKLPTWRPSNAAHQVHDQRHHEKLGEIVAAVTPKVPVWKRLVCAGKEVEAPKIEVMGAALVKLDRYLDATALSFKTIEREERAIQNVIDKMTIISDRLSEFQEALTAKIIGPVLNRLTKALKDKKADIAVSHASHNYAKGSYFMARNSLEISADQARLLRKAINLSINAQKMGKTCNRLEQQKIPEYQSRRRDPNQIRHLEKLTPPTATEKLATLTSKVSQSLVHQQKAINLMEENSRNISGLSEPR